MSVSWVPGINALAGRGRGAFEEFRDVCAIAAAFGRFVYELVDASAAHGALA